jgi:hypothetical protein
MSLQADAVFLRAEKAAQILKVQSQDLLKVLADEGITDDSDGFSLLNSPAITVDDLADLLAKGLSAKKLPAKVAASVLKNAGESPQINRVEATQVSPAAPGVADIAKLIKESRPIEQWEDRELLEKFSRERSAEVEEELDRRAKRQKFIILMPGKFEPGKEQIDIDSSLALLKMARKRTTPSVMPSATGFSIVYRITELDMRDRVLEICPFCGESLYQGYCEKCQLTFASIGDDERAYIRLISDSDQRIKGSLSDRKAILASGFAGLDDLKTTWPSLAQRFDELKLTNSLPKLRVIENRPSTKVVDPFMVDGNRAFGNRSY